MPRLHMLLKEERDRRSNTLKQIVPETQNEIIRQTTDPRSVQRTAEASTQSISLYTGTSSS